MHQTPKALVLLFVALLVLIASWSSFSKLPRMNVPRYAQLQSFDKTVQRERKLPAQNYDSSRFHLISFFYLPSEESYAKQDRKFVEKREKELIYCLQKNLNNSLIASITLFTANNETQSFVSHLRLAGQHKLVVLTVNDTSNEMAMGYISDHFIGKVVMFANQDVYAEESLSRVSVDYMKTQNLVYALTRHNHPNYTCPLLKKTANCNNGMDSYQQSHDVLIFVLKSHIPTTYLQILRGVEQHQFGQENLLLWWFRQKLNYRVTNPCKVLKFYHRHCFRKDKPNKASSRSYAVKLAKGYMTAAFTESLL